MIKYLSFCFLIVSNLSHSQSKNSESIWSQNSSFEFMNANGFEIELKEISIIDIEQKFGPIWNVIFSPNLKRIIFTRGKNGSNEIVVKDMETLNDIVSFKGSRLHAVSPDGTRIFYDNSIYDIRQLQNYKINAEIYSNTVWRDGNIDWIDENYIISYKNIKSNNEIKPISNKYLKLDLNDLQIKAMSSEKVNKSFNELQKLNSNHPNFYLYTFSTSDIIIQDKMTPFSKSILHSRNGVPIKHFWSSPNLEYIVVNKYSERYPNKYELVLYKLQYKENSIPLFFKAKQPTEFLSGDFKQEYLKTNGKNIWCDVYEPKINPLNNTIVGSDKSKYKGSMKIVKNLNDEYIGLMVGFYKADVKNDFVVTNFRKSENIKDTNGAWTALRKWDIQEECNIDFSKLSVNIDDLNVILLHKILNADPKTMLFEWGVNSPGNESSLFTNDTSSAIKKLQKIKGIPQTGIIDNKTSVELNKRCVIVKKIQAIKQLN